MHQCIRKVLIVVIVNRGVNGESVGKSKRMVNPWVNRRACKDKLRGRDRVLRLR